MSVRNPSSYLPHLIGPIDFQVEGVDASVERRGTINLIGLTVTDDPDNDRTNVEATTGGGGTTPTGTGFVGVTGGVQNAAAIKVDLASSTYVTGTLAAGNGGTGLTSLGSNVATWMGTPSSANLAAALTDETGTGLCVFSVGPRLETPSIWNSGLTFRYVFGGSAIAANRTITLPLLTGDDTFVFAAHAQTLTNKTIAGASNTLSVRIANDVTGLGSGVATFLATPSSANLLAAVTDETGTGALVFGTSPTISAPTLSSTPVLSGASSSTSNNAKGTCVDVNPVNVQTTDATVTTLDSFTIASGSAVVVSWLVSAIQSTSANAAGYSVSAVFRNNAGTVTQSGTTTVTVLGESDSAWDCTCDNSTTTIRLRVTGKAATTIQWTSILTRLTVVP